MNSPNGDVFLSGDDADAPILASLVRYLEAQGLRVTQGRDDQHSGNYSQRATARLIGFPAVLVVWTGRSIESRDVAAEAEEAASTRRLVSVLLDDVEIPYGLRRARPINLVGWDGETETSSLIQLTRDLKDLVEAGPQSRHPGVMPARPRNALPEGYTFEGFEILGVLGAGGFGLTYLAREDVFERLVAIKEYLPNDIAARHSDGTRVQHLSEKHAADYEWGLDRFQKEARILAQLTHPNIVPVYRYFEANGTAYMVMEYQKGASLSELLSASGPLEEGALRALVLPLIEGLAEVHANGILHRDIKPGNIYVRGSGEPVLLDFGAARQAIGSRSKPVTAIVTPGYAPLEQYSSETENEQGPWTDIYALGAVLYRAATGETPIDSIQRSQRMRKGGDDPLVPLRERIDGRIDPAFLSAVEAALAVDYEDRPQDLEAFRTMIEAGRAAPRQELVPPRDKAAEKAARRAAKKPERERKPRVPREAHRNAPKKSDGVGNRRRWTMVAGAALLGLVVIGGLAYALVVLLDQEQQEASLVELVQRTEQALAAGDLDTAERSLGEAERLRPGDPALFPLRRRLNAAREQAQAQAAQRAQQEQQVTRLIEEARAAMERGDFKGARFRIDQAAALQPDSEAVRGARERLAELSGRQGNRPVK